MLRDLDQQFVTNLESPIFEIIFFSYKTWILKSCSKIRVFRNSCSRNGSGNRRANNFFKSRYKSNRTPLFLTFSVTIKYMCISSRIDVECVEPQIEKTCFSSRCLIKASSASFVSRDARYNKFCQQISRAEKTQRF